MKYASQITSGPILACGQPSRFGDLVPLRDVVRGRFQCNPATGVGCDAYEDVVVVAAKSLGGGSFDEAGTIRVVFGAKRDVSLEDNLFDIPGTNVELVPQPLPGGSDPRDPRTAEIGDFNGDDHDDLAVLFGSSEEVHVWLGASNKGLGEVSNGIALASCELSLTPDSECSPLREFALPDFDGDGRDEVAVVCDPAGVARLRWYTPVTP